jgi:predicted Fe-Mo cluster-binding NifX family protein
MKYAITSRGKSLNARIDAHFGRCEYIVIYDLETKGWEFLPNPYKELDEGVGPLLVEMLHEKGISRIVSGSFGINIKDLLDSKHIQMIIPKDDKISVSSIIEMVENR